jgi:hypothetical protein
MGSVLGRAPAVFAQGAGYPEVQITITPKCELESPSGPIAATLVAITLINDCSEPFQVQVAQLSGGIDLATLQNQLLADEIELDQVVKTFYGGPGAIPPGGTQQVVLNLQPDFDPYGSQPGDYVLLGSIPGQPPVLTLFTTEAPTSGSDVVPPEALVTVTITDEVVDLPIIKVDSDPHYWEIRNDAAQPRGLVLVRVSADTSEGEVLDAWHDNGSVPTTAAAGGMRLLSAGRSGWLWFELPPGEYLVLADSGNDYTSPPAPLALSVGRALR